MATTQITSAKQLDDLLKSKALVVVDFFADWCGPCKQIAPIYDQLAQNLVSDMVVFGKVNTENQKDIAARYNVTALPTFIIFRDGRQVEKVEGADRAKLSSTLLKLSKEMEDVLKNGKARGSGSGSGSSGWRGADLPRGYFDVTDQLEIKMTDAANYDDTEAGNVRVLFDSSKPTALSNVKGDKDWMESDTDEQLMLFLPFQSVLKLHTLQITSLPPQGDDEAPMRPRQIKLFVNKPHMLGFDEAENMAATQVIELSEKDWNKEGTASIPLRFVKFQNINSLVIFIVDGAGSSEKVRVDRIRLIGESGPSRELGKLEKIGDEPGE